MFYTYNNIAIFSSDVLASIPTFIEKTTHYPPVPTLCATDLIVALIDSKYPITLDHFHNISGVNGICIINQAFLILYLNALDVNTKRLMINVITSILTHSLKCKLLLSDPDFDQQSHFFSHAGFLDPIFNIDPPSIEMSWHKQITPSITLSSINKIVSSLKKDRVVLNLIISQNLASTLSKIIHFMNEGAGTLFLTNYTQNGDGVLGVNSKYIIEGGPNESSNPNPLTPFVFHSHPDRITIENKAFIAWPSGQDMRVVAGSFFTNRPQLVHMVISPEGIWVVMTSYEYQQVAKKMLKANLADKAMKLVNEIRDVFTQLEKYRVTDTIDPLYRHQTDQHYMVAVSKIKIGTVLKDEAFRDFANFPIFKLNYFKWSVFDNPTNVVSVTVEYLPTVVVGAYLPPYNPYSD
jgi:hypothetical protein